MVRYAPAKGHLPETTPPGTVVLQLNATDLDAGENGRVRYAFLPGDRGPAQRIFSLDPVSGQLKIEKRLDYDIGPRHFKFKVSAVAIAVVKRYVDARCVCQSGNL